MMDGMKGGGIQYRSQLSVNELIKAGYLEVISGPIKP